MSIEQKPWFEWMESAVAKMYDSNIDSMALVARLQDGNTLTAYYEASDEDKAAMIYHVMTDMVLDTIKVNADVIKDYLEEAAP